MGEDGCELRHAVGSSCLLQLTGSVIFWKVGNLGCRAALVCCYGPHEGMEGSHQAWLLV